MLFEIVKRMNSLPGSRRQVPEDVLSFCSSCIYNPSTRPMHTPTSTNVQKKILEVKWELGGGVAGLKLLLTFPVSRICQIFGVSAASRLWRFRNQLGFRPRGRPRRKMRQRCGVVSTSKAAHRAPHERHPLAAPLPASPSKAAAPAASVQGGTAASVTIKSGRASGQRRRQRQSRQRQSRQRQSRQRQSRQRHPRQRQSRQQHPRQRQSRQRHRRQRQSRQRHPRQRTRNRKGEGKQGQGERAAWAGKEKTRACGCRRMLVGRSWLKDICPQVPAKLRHSPEISKNICFF